MNKFDQLQSDLKNSPPRTWLVTGVAGFIGSNLLEALLSLNQRVVGLDNFALGKAANLEDVRRSVGETRWQCFRFIEGDITSMDDCVTAVQGTDHVLHQAALGSVPRSIKHPELYNTNNTSGFVNILIAARDAGVKSFVYASSSSVYGDRPDLPKVEDKIGNPLSPYALTKRTNELYAELFARNYGFTCMGLRYFNVFGRRQDPNGAYAAVIPKWVNSLLNHEPCHINGDGETSRDFCYVANVVQANLIASVTDNADARNQVYNIAYGQRTTLTELYRAIRDGLSTLRPDLADLHTQEVSYGPFRQGDIRHSLADISKAQRLLGYAPTHSVQQGLAETLAWYASATSKL